MRWVIFIFIMRTTFEVATKIPQIPKKKKNCKYPKIPLIIRVTFKKIFLIRAIYYSLQTKRKK